MANRNGTAQRLWRRFGLLAVGVISGYALLLGAPGSRPASPLVARSLAVTPPTSADGDTSWENVLKPMARKKRTLGSRGEICPLFPTAKAAPLLVWNQAPMLVWRGTIRRLEVHALNQPDALWRTTIVPTRDVPYRSVQYTGPSLQPGQTYEWQLYGQFAGQATTPTLRLPFRTMATGDRDNIAAQLNALETRLKAKAASAETITQQQAKFFSDRQLWADALQAALAVKSPSPALKNAMQAVAEQYCDSENTAAPADLPPP